MPRKTPKREETRVDGSAVSVTLADGLPDSDSTMQGDTRPLDQGQHETHSGLSGSKAAFSHDSLHTLGRGVKELVQAVQALRHLGVRDLDLPLPKIVVVGDQSTGKSSLIEAMSEIKVPRSAGTCTRCPLEINLSQSEADAWKCIVTLSKKYTYEGNLGNRHPGKGLFRSEGATRDRPLGPWLLQDIEDLHFTTINSKDEVPEVLRLAQLATLNPGNNHKQYLPGKDPSPYLQVKFSPNVIRLDISSPDLPNLSFYDLPGIFQSPDTPEEGYLVNLVRNLVKEYVQTQDSINLLAMPMTDDTANCSTFQLIRDLKAEPRTMGCLTKPDRLQEGESMKQWIDILKGERYPLGLGYFVIKNNPDPSVDHAAARVEEATFFDNTEPWATLLRSHNPRFGASLLQTELSQLLTAQIQKSLPKIISQVKEKAANIHTKLMELPEPIHGNLPAIVLGKLMKFKDAIQRQIDGGSKEHMFQKMWNEKAQEFLKSLADTRPVIKMPSKMQHSQAAPSTPSKNRGTPSSTSSSNKDTITIESDSDDDQIQQTPISRTRKKRAHADYQATPIKTQRTANNPPCQSAFTQTKNFDLLEVRSIISDAYIGGIPGQIHPKAIEEMIQASVAHWENPLEVFLQATQRLCENMVSDQVHAVFEHHQNTRFFLLIMEVCQSFFEDVFAQQRHLAKRILSWEISKPKTLNEEAMSIARDKAMTLLQNLSKEICAHNFVEEQEKKTGKFTTGMARKEKLAKVPEKDLGSETYHRELFAMSFVKAFYEISYSRFVDIVCSSIHCELFGKCRNDLYDLILQKFGVTDDDANERLAMWLAANPIDEIRRVQLLKEKGAIEKAEERLQGLL